MTLSFIQFFGALVFRMAGMGALFLSFLLSAMYLNIEDFGNFQTYFVALTTINYLCLLGANEYIFKKTKYLSKQRLVQLIFKVFNITLPVSLFLLVIFLFMIFLYDEQNILFVAILFFSLPFNVINLTLANAFKGNDHQSAFILSSGFIQNVSLMFLTLLLNKHLTLTNFSYIYLISTALTLLFSLTFLIKNYPISIKFIINNDLKLFNHDWRESINYYFLTIISLVFVSADLWVIKIIGNDSDLGLYAFAVKVASIVNIVHTSSANFYISKLVSLNHTNEQIKLKNLFLSCIKNNLIIIVPLVVILFGFLLDILYLFFEGYTEVANIIWILILAQMINLLTGPCGLALSYTNKLSVLVKSNLLSLIIYIILLYIFYNSFGIYGIAFSYLIYMIGWNIFLAILFKSEFNFYPLLK